MIDAGRPHPRGDDSHHAEAGTPQGVIQANVGHGMTSPLAQRSMTCTGFPPENEETKTFVLRSGQDD